VDQFEIWIVSLDPTRGSEMRKTRPAVIVSNSSLNDYLNTVIVAPLTSTIKDYPFRIDNNFRGKDGQIALDQIRCVDKTRLIEKVGELTDEEEQDVTDILKLIFEKI